MNTQLNAEQNLWIIKKPIGEILEDAGLISQYQIEIALIDQNSYVDTKLGEILALRGWVKQETANFFAEDFPELVNKPDRMRLGEYLMAASLLEEKQVEDILQEQLQIGIKFGYVAVLKGYIKQETLDFFLTHLNKGVELQSGIYQKKTLIQDSTEIIDHSSTVVEKDISSATTIPCPENIQEEEEDPLESISWLH
jgi:hypothetical protein